MKTGFLTLHLLTIGSAFQSPPLSRWSHDRPALFMSTTADPAVYLSSNKQETNPENSSKADEISLQTKYHLSPAEYENERFQCDENVEFWRNFNKNADYEEQDFIRVASEVSNRFLMKGGEALNYWLRHTARTGYFASNAALGILFSQAHERLRSSDSEGNFANSVPSFAPRLLSESMLIYEQDYERISQGKYKLPYDMYTRNRQNSPLYFGSKTARFVSEAIGTLSRRNRGSEEDKRVWLSGDDSIYPDYYKTAFHYQTDGWLSQDSAEVYETSTETLFLGTQDAMQRVSLVPLVEYANNFSISSSSGGRPLKVLEVGCGTGRFLTFVRDNLPLDAECTAVDLSPFYLNCARDNDKNWMNIRKRIETSERNDEGVQIRPSKFVQSKAEDLPFEDEEFDIVMCVYVYHEVPRDIRTKISSEMERVTKKGGIVILTDSIQKGDRPCLDNVIGKFSNFNEPFYEDYIKDYLPRHFENVGLECSTKILCRNTKSLSFIKPL